MSKPLELKTFTIWESLGGTMYADVSAEDVVNVDYEVYRKRLSDTELAAEYWSLNYYGSGAQFNEASSGDPYSDEFWETHYDRVNTLHRFTTLPHYDEDKP